MSNPPPAPKTIEPGLDTEHKVSAAGARRINGRYSGLDRTLCVPTLFVPYLLEEASWTWNDWTRDDPPHDRVGLCGLKYREK